MITFLFFIFFIFIGVLKYIEKKVDRSRKNKGGGKEDEDLKNIEKLPFFKKALVTPSEVKLFSLLVEACPNHFIFTQVVLSQLVGIPKDKNYMANFNRISRMSLDFVICDPALNTVLVIELDDPTHDRAKRKAQDLKKDSILGAAAIRIVRIRVESVPSLDQLKTLLAI